MLIKSFWFEKLVEIFDKIRGSLNDDGVLSFSVKWEEGEEWSTFKLERPRYFCYWSPEQLKSFLEERGFDVLAMTKNNAFLQVITKVKQSMKNFAKVQKSEMKIIGIACRTSNESGKGPFDIPKLWERFYQEGIFAKIPQKASNEVVALYCDYEKDHTKDYTCVIGCFVDSLNEIPEGMVGKTVPASTFARYSVKGDFPKSLIDTWGCIWRSDLSRTYVGDLEVYGLKFQDAKEMEVFVAIEE